MEVLLTWKLIYCSLELHWLYFPNTTTNSKHTNKEKPISYGIPRKEKNYHLNHPGVQVILLHIEKKIINYACNFPSIFPIIGKTNMIVFIKRRKLSQRKQINIQLTFIYSYTDTIEVQCMSNNALNATSNSEMSNSV